MARLFPRSREVSVERNGKPSLISLDDDRAADLLGALSSDAAREVFLALNDQPKTPSDLADELEMSIQRVRYHLGNLQEVDAVEVIDTCYSEKGREMEVYGPPKSPQVVFVGTADDQPRLTAAFRELCSGVGAAAITIAAAETFGDLIGQGD